MSAYYIDEGTKVEIQLRYHQGKKDYPFFLVRLFSKVRPELISQGAVDPRDGDSHKRCMVVAGALAEYQCRNYHDHHDPDCAAKAAGEAFKMLIDQLRNDRNSRLA